MFANVLIVGNGGFGTAIATVLAERGIAARLTGHDADYTARLRDTRENPKYLPGVRLPEAVAVTTDLAEACHGVDLIVAATPTQHVRSMFERVRPHWPAGVPIVSLAKGLERSTARFPSEVLRDVLGDGAPVAVLCGPSHAEEVARRRPTSVVVASDDEALARGVQETLRTERLRIYTSRDRTGVELAGAVKNVIAIAAGICDGLALGDNAKAALITRGAAEIARLGVPLGADPRTFAGLAGVGDLITTCVSPHGRNRWVGEQLGRGRKIAEILASMSQVAEGVFSTRAVLDLARRHGVSVPITAEVAAVLEGKDPLRAVSDLMTRDARGELDDPV